jgi:putative transcriptional regulator
MFSAQMIFLAETLKMESQLDICPGPSYADMESQLYMAPSVQNRVKDLRIARGWTQEQLADAVRVSRQSINSIERDRYVPSLPLALTFARIFGCSTDEIFTLSGEVRSGERREGEGC